MKRALASLLLVAACGGGDDGQPTDDDDAAAGGHDAAVDDAPGPTIDASARRCAARHGIDTALRNAAYFYNREVQESIARVQGLVEPLLTLAMGAVLGWLMLAVLGPMYDLLSRIRF